jgi:long-chain acyl-CoA synthetase
MGPPWRRPGAIRFGAALAAGARAPRPPATGIGRGDIAFLQYTGGTTGVSKAAILTHGNILANLDQVYAWMAPTLRPEARLLRVVTPLPLYHIFSLTANCLTFMKMGGCNILVPNPRDISGLVRLLGRCRWNVMTGVNTLFNALLQAPGFARLDFSGVIAVVAGGTALQAAVAERWQRVTGVALCEGYGLTETSPVVCANLLGAPRIGTVGLPLPSTEISIRDEAGVELPPGEAGQLWVRGPQVMRGYWNRPDETGPVLSPEGFLATGDIATVDAQGYVRIVDRSKDMISVSGFKVYPNELEDLIAGVPGVAEVACIGVPDPHSGEAVALFVVPRADAPTGPALESALRAHCERHLTGYKRPRHIHFRTQLPKSTVGKILRRALRDEAARGDGA